MINFTLHFERECQAIKRVHGIAVQNTGYHQQANAMTTILSEMKQECSQILMEVKETEEKILRAMQLSSEESSEERDDRESKSTLHENGCVV